MLSKKNTLISIIVTLLFIIIYFNSPLKSNKNYPIIDGSFIQLDLTQNWDIEKWRSELSYLKKNKMNYLIITGTSSTSGTTTKTVYKSNIPNTNKIYGDIDPVDLCLKASQELNIKVFVETNFNSEWWQKSGDDPKWLNLQMERSNIIADELYSKYHTRYPNTFYGWYFPYEVDNAKFNKTHQFNNLSNAINDHLRHLKQKNERLPILISPFMNSSCGTAKEYADNWKYLFSKTDFEKGDIFCPQDSVGSGRLNLYEVNPWFTELKKAVAAKPGLLFWANAENFDYVNNSSAPLNRFLQQIKLLQPCVDNIISFSYSHYYSPNNINPGFHKAYSEYVKRGKLSKGKLEKPENLTVKSIGKDEFNITWTKPKNEENISGYQVYRNGILISSKVVQRKYGGNANESLFSIIDKPELKEGIESYTYEVKSVDFSGNTSKSSNIVRINVDPDKKKPKLVSKNCKYTLLPMPDENYNDIGLNKLTDGEYSPINSVKDKSFVGWYSNPIDITIDLGEAKPVQQFVVNYLREPMPWIQLPEKASIGISSDGVNFKPVGLLRIPTVPFSDRGGSKYQIYLTLDTPIEARYVKLTSITTPYTYSFIDEFEVRSN